MKGPRMKGPSEEGSVGRRVRYDGSAEDGFPAEEGPEFYLLCRGQIICGRSHIRVQSISYTVHTGAFHILY